MEDVKERNIVSGRSCLYVVSILVLMEDVKEHSSKEEAAEQLLGFQSLF